MKGFKPGDVLVCIHEIPPSIRREYNLHGVRLPDRDSIYTVRSIDVACLCHSVWLEEIRNQMCALRCTPHNLVWRGEPSFPQPMFRKLFGDFCNVDLREVQELYLNKPIPQDVEPHGTGTGVGNGRK